MKRTLAKSEIIKKITQSGIKTSTDLMRIKRQIARESNLSVLPNSEIISLFRSESIPLPDVLAGLLKKRAVRTMSGIAPVAVLTQPYPCPGKCAYCPTEKDVPQSYLSNEPAVMRAIRCGYDPYTQVQDRLKALITNGHNPEKIELIVIGGTWSVLPREYKYWYILRCFKAANDHGTNEQKHKIGNRESGIDLDFDLLKDRLLREEKKNETAKYRIIGITLETRPDYINYNELAEMRELGCTRVELGVQAIDDSILKLNRRGHDVQAIAAATALLRAFGFKITYHLMPGLPGANAKKDLSMFKQLFSDERFQPDQIKFYPTVVTKGSLLHRWWKQGKYKPYSDKVLRNLITVCKKAVPPYVRIIRLIRDIPPESIVAGNAITNLRQIMKQEGAECQCIRCREVGERKSGIGNWELGKIKYKASGGTEFFISFESLDAKKLYGFCRLRLPGNGGPAIPDALSEAAIIRELHVYGKLTPIGQSGHVQHAGLGRQLMAEAEKIAHENGFKKIAVISGIGVRGYYRKLGYRQKGGYMLKRVDASNFSRGL